MLLRRSATACGFPCPTAAQCVGGQEAPYPSIAIFHATFLPGRGRQAEIAGDAEPVSQCRKSGKFRAPIEGDAAPEGRGDAPQTPIDAGHDPSGMPARIMREESEAAAAFDQRGEIGFAILSPKNQKMAFPMSESAAIRNFRRSCADRIDHSNMETAWLTSVA